MGIFNKEENGAIVPVVAMVAIVIIIIGAYFSNKQELSIHVEALAVCVEAGMEYIDGDCKVPVQSD